MASITKKPNSKFWYACYRLPDGTQKRTSTKTEDKRKAMQIALSYEAVAHEVAKASDPKAMIRERVEEIVRLAGINLEPERTTRDFIESQWRGMQVKEDTITRRKVWLDEFATSIGHKIDRPPSEITSHDVEQFRDDQIQKGNVSRTINFKLTALGSAFKRAHASGEIPRNPFFGMSVTGGDAQEREPFTTEQIKQLLEKTTGEWRVFIALCYYTGQRQQQCAKLKCEAIDLDALEITFPPFKGRKKPLRLPISTHLAKILTDYGRVAPGDYLLPAMAAFNRHNLSRAFRFQILPKIGVVQSRPKPGSKGRKFAKLTLHSLRHSLSTHLEALGVSEAGRMAILGHTSKEVNLGYTHASLEVARANLEKLG